MLSMPDLSIYFSALEPTDTHYTDDQIGSKIISNNGIFPELSSEGIALIFVPEFRGDNEFTENNLSIDGYRSAFYKLHAQLTWKFNIYDLGNILPGNELNDTYFAVAQVVSTLIKKRIIPVIIGGSQDLTLAMYAGYEKLEQTINTCSIDYKLDLGNIEKTANSDGYMSHLLMKRPCYLFNHANIGLQIPYAGSGELELFEKLFFDVCRLGEFNADFRKAEPHLRNADLLSIDFMSIKSSEIGLAHAIPNGFYAEQICQIAKYAGISDKLSSLGIFNHHSNSTTQLADHLLAEIIWYFIDGYAERKADFPVGSKKDYTQFIVTMENMEDDIIFYRSNKSERWWLEVPYPPQEGMKYERHHMIPCDHADYEKAMNNELPDLWWKTYQKLS